MKLEMGESLFYSWLRHVKDCQVVQTNWKVSPTWQLLHADELQEMFVRLGTFFSEKYGYPIFKKNASVSQFIQQSECDVLGISIQYGLPSYHAVDVAFHEGGLNYGTREETVAKVVSKCIRTAFCLYGYMNSREGEIVFASPKINPSVENDILPCIADLNSLFQDMGYSYIFKVICNADFDTHVMQPILLTSKDVSDTSELFMRSYQLWQMFESKPIARSHKASARSSAAKPVEQRNESYKEIKIGKLAQTVLKNILESGTLTTEEIQWLQTAQYSKDFLGLNYPLLVKDGTDFERIRYYTFPVKINGEIYYMCSQWFETSANNDRPYLEKWIAHHSEQMTGV